MKYKISSADTSFFASQSHIAISVTLEADFCIEALQRVLVRAPPELFNSAQFDEEKPEHGGEMGVVLLLQEHHEGDFPAVPQVFNGPTMRGPA